MIILLQSLGQFSEAEQMLLKSFTVADRLEEIAIASVAAGNLGLLYRETQDLDDSALIFYPTAGLSYVFDGP